MKNFDSSNFETLMVRAGKGRTDMTEKLVVDIEKLRAACTDYVKSHNKPNISIVFGMSCIPGNIFSIAKRQFICYFYKLRQTDEKVKELKKTETRGLLTFDMLYDIHKSFELTAPIEEFLYKKGEAEDIEGTSHKEIVTIPITVSAMDDEFGERFLASAKASDLYTVVYLAVKNGLEG